jgi:putative transposase
MKAVTDTLGVSRSRQYERRKEGPGPRRGHYQKADDGRYLALIRQIIDGRMTCGYRRVTVFLNRLLAREEKPSVNPKRVYRIMKINGLLLQRHTGRPIRTHDGTVMRPRSNERWCSDVFENPCWNGERIRVAFAMDCCDREVMSWVATTGSINGEIIRDLMTEAMEARFGLIHQVPGRIEWLSDNAPAYTARDTMNFARLAGLEACTTPYYSPESNGMAEAFIKTFKRDYVTVHPLTNARSVMDHLSAWFEDYNENHPHKGLKMMSPREYRRLAAKLETCPGK